jgi:putative spermidine/putrescine transport system permease protein
MRREAPQKLLDYVPLAFPAIMLTVFFVIPFGTMIAVSFFQRQQGGFYTPAFVLSNYERFASLFFANVLGFSLMLAVLVAICCVAIGVPFTYLLTRMSRRAQIVWMVALLSVLSLSEVIIGFAWSTLFSRTAGITNLLVALGLMEKAVALSPGFPAVLTAMVYQALPYTILVLYPALVRLDPTLTEAARTLGASPLRAFFTVVVPALRATILATLIMVFIFALGSYLAAPDPWPTAALDTVGADHRPGDLPVQHAVRSGHGRIPRACHARHGRADAVCRPQAGGRRMSLFLRRFYFVLVGLFLAAPLIVVAGVSVNARQTLAFPPQGFSLAWYVEIFADTGWRNALFASLTLATLSAALAVAIALPLSWFLWRRIAPWANIFQLLGIAPFTLPPVITALGLLTFWATTGFYGQPWTAVISHAIFFVTLPLVTLSLGFSAIDRSLVEAAATMGADDRTIFRTVVLPLITPYLVSGYAFAFVLSLNEYIVAYMTVGFTMETLPIKIFNALRYGYTPTMASVTVLFVVLAAVIYSLIARYGDLLKLLGANSEEKP